MPSQVILHVGTHRTGSTSLQRFLAEHRDGVVREAGYRYPVGMVDADSHIELGLASLRPSRLTELAPFGDWLHTQLGLEARTIDPSWAERVRSEAGRTSDDTLLYSCENLSWIRHPDEVAGLQALFPGARLTALMFTRDPADFLASYASMSRFLIGPGDDDPDSVWHIGPSTWLVDYQACLETDGSTIPTVLDLLGIDRSALASTDDYFVNRRPR